MELIHKDLLFAICNYLVDIRQLSIVNKQIYDWLITHEDFKYWSKHQHLTFEVFNNNDVSLAKKYMNTIQHNNVIICNLELLSIFSYKANLIMTLRESINRKKIETVRYLFNKINKRLLKPDEISNILELLYEP